MATDVEKAGLFPRAKRLPSGQRLEWIDTAKGLGIILVVYGHQIRSQMAAGQFAESWHLGTQDATIYSFHMPLFFFLSGLVLKLPQRVVDIPKFYAAKANALLVPFVLWTAISFLLGALGGGYVHNKMSISSLLSIWKDPLYQYWFLYALFLIQISIGTISTKKVVIYFLVLTMICLPVHTNFAILAEFWSGFPFVGLGLSSAVAVKRWIDDANRIVIAFFAIASTTAFTIVSYIIGPVGHASSMLIAILGVVSIILAAAALGKDARTLSAIGRYSMPIFILHTICSVAARIVIGKLRLEPIYFMYVSTIIGVCGPILMYKAFRTVGLQKFLALGNVSSGPRVPYIESGRS